MIPMKPLLMRKKETFFLLQLLVWLLLEGAFAWSLIDTMNPSKDVLALSTTEVDLSPLEEGQSLTVMWRKANIH